MFKLKVLLYVQLTEEERKAIVLYRLEKAENALVEAKDCVLLHHWNLAANRLYYTVYYASSALLISAGHAAKTHEYYVRLNKKHDNTSNNYIFRLPQDKNKEIFLEVMAFNFDKTKE